MIINNQLIFYIKGVLNTSVNQVCFICNDIEIIETYLELSSIVYYQNSRDRQKHILYQFRQEKGKKSRSLFRGILENPIESMSQQHFRNGLEPCGKPSVCCFSVSLHFGSILALLPTAFLYSSVEQCGVVASSYCTSRHMDRSSCPGEQELLWENLAVPEIMWNMKRQWQCLENRECGTNI